jgi:acetyl-CoA carboxylase biotin carboxyl carrier protein
MTNDIKSKVKSLYEIMQEENIQELKINSKDYSVSIKRKNYKESKDQSAAKKNHIDIQTIDFENNQKDQVISSETIKSPLTGVLYKSPSPTSLPFVNVGDIVEIGDIVCIIEAMKVMNEIKSTFKAKIIKSLVENGKSISAGQDLFEVEKL